MSKRTGRERSKIEKDRDRALISSLYCRGWTYETIGVEVGKLYPAGADPGTAQVQPGKPFSKAHVHKEMKFIRKMWLRDRLGKYAERQAEELAKIDAIEREAWAAWRRSVGEQIDSIDYADQVVAVDGDDMKTAQPYRTVERTRQHAGSPRFLDIVLTCIEQRCKILGIGTREDPTSLETPEYGTKNIYGIPAFVTKEEWTTKYASGPTVVINKGQNRTESQH